MPITSVALDGNGDGTVDFTGTTLEGVTVTFTEPGLYFPRVTVTDNTGTARTAEAAILVNSPLQMGQNAGRDLWGYNRGDFIVFQFEAQEGTAHYVVYRSSSPTGPWEEVAYIRGDSSRSSKVDVTPDARLMDLCYRVDALDASELVLRVYEPMCVPKFIP
jgi:hypothetical protein